MDDKARHDFLVNDLRRRIDENFKLGRDDMVVLYGSGATGKVTSDFDFCFIKKHVSKKDIKKMTEIAIAFHKENGLKLDDEVPHDNKLLYSRKQALSILLKTPFKKGKDGLVIDEIQKTKEFLSSNQIKERLLFNVFTTNSIAIHGNTKKFEQYKAKAWDSLSKAMFSYGGNAPLSREEFVKNLCTNQKDETKAGEDFLGYKENRPLVMNYLRLQTARYFNYALKSGKAVEENGKLRLTEKTLNHFHHQLRKDNGNSFARQLLNKLKMER